MIAETFIGAPYKSGTEDPFKFMDCKAVDTGISSLPITPNEKWSPGSLYTYLIFPNILKMTSWFG